MDQTFAYNGITAFATYFGTTVGFYMATDFPSICKVASFVIGYQFGAERQTVLNTDFKPIIAGWLGSCYTEAYPNQVVETGIKIFVLAGLIGYLFKKYEMSYTAPTQVV